MTKLSLPVALALLTPTLLLLLLLVGLPQAELLARSLDAPHWTASSYVRFLGDPFRLGILARTLMFAGWVTALSLILGMPLAYLAARSSERWGRPLLLLCTFPLWVTGIVRTFAWTVLLGRGGVVSLGLQALGLVRHPVQLTSTMTGVIVAETQVLLPVMMLSLYGVMRSIDPEMESAAQNLGASPVGAFLFVVLPLAARGILSATLLVFILAIGAFATPSVIGGPRVPFMSTMIYDQMVELDDWSYASVGSVILLVIVLSITILYVRLGAALGGRPVR